jgi:WD40 repeat protein
MAASVRGALSLAWSGPGLKERRRAQIQDREEDSEDELEAEGGARKVQEDVFLLAVSGGFPLGIAAASDKKDSLTCTLGIEPGTPFLNTPADGTAPELRLNGFSHPADCCALALFASARVAIADNRGGVHVFEISRFGGSTEDEIDSKIEPDLLLSSGPDAVAHTGGDSVEGVQRPLAFSMDGSLLAGAVAGKEAVVWDVGGNVDAERKPKEPEEDRVVARLRYSDRFDQLVFFSVAWSPDGQFLAFGLEQGRVCLYSTDTFQHLRLLSFDMSSFTALSISPDSETILAGREGYESLYVWPLQKAVVTRRHLGENCRVQLAPMKIKALCLLEDGLCCAANGTTLTIFDTATGKVHQHLLTGSTLSVVATDACSGVVVCAHHWKPDIQVYTGPGSAMSAVKSARKMG